MTAKSVIVADDDRSVRTVLQHALSQAGYEVHLASSSASVMRWIEKSEGDVLLTDVLMPEENMFDLLPRIAKMRPDLPIVVMSAQSTFQTAVKASQLGAFDYLPKPFDLDDVLSVIANALESRETEGRVKPDDSVPESVPLIGRSPAMQDVFRTLARASTTNLTVLITGESGTGKEVVARSLHEHGVRSEGPFITVDVASIPSDRIEAALFGIERGTYAGGVDRTDGFFGQAEGGTLFLDEVGDMPLEAQTRLLRVLQDGHYLALGGRTLRQADVRIVAASRYDLAELVREGRFREDLFYRLNVVPVHLPALRQRTEDIPELVRYFMDQAASRGLGPKTLSRDSLEALSGQRWPGNVRQLENFLQRLCVLHPEERIGIEQVMAALKGVEGSNVKGAGTASMASVVDEGDHLSAAVTYHLKRYFARHGEDLPASGLYERVMREVERPLIELTLANTRGNQLQAANLLGLNRNTLRKKIKDLGIDVVKAVGK